MAQFPAISPSSISLSLGGSNITRVETMTMGDVLFEHSASTDNLKCTATFENILSSQVASIDSHFQGQGGSALSFSVDASTFWGAIDFVPSNSKYRYVEPPSDEHFGVYNTVSVTLSIALGVIRDFLIAGEPAKLGSNIALDVYPFTGTAPFIFNADDADPAVAASFILNGNGAS